MEAMVLGAEADLDAEALERQRSGGRSVIFLLLVVLVLVAGALAWIVLGDVQQGASP
jgi:hypothetical protein